MAGHAWPKDFDHLDTLVKEDDARDYIVKALGKVRDVNWKTLKRRTLYFNAACFLLIVQIALWAWLLLTLPPFPKGI